MVSACIINTGIIITWQILDPIKKDLWTIGPYIVLWAIIIVGGFLQIWRPSKITKQDFLRTIVLFLIGCFLVVSGFGGFDQIKHIDLKKLNDVGFLASLGLLVSYASIWSFIRIASYWALNRADFKSMD